LSFTSISFLLSSIRLFAQEVKRSVLRNSDLLWGFSSGSATESAQVGVAIATSESGSAILTISKLFLGKEERTETAKNSGDAMNQRGMEQDGDHSFQKPNEGLQERRTNIGLDVTCPVTNARGFGRQFWIRRFVHRLFVMFVGVWCLAAIVFSSDWAFDGMGDQAILALIGFALGVAWVMFTCMNPELFRSWRWWSLPAAGILAVVIWITDFGMIIRLRLSENQLLAHVQKAPTGPGLTMPPGWVGLFWVYRTEQRDGAVYLFRGSYLITDVGLAYIPAGFDPKTHRRATHLYGPWYRLTGINCF
jgi:hypothetical protein